MKKKLLCLLLGSSLLFSAAACNAGGDSDTFGGSISVEHAPNVSFDTSGAGLADESIKSDIFVYTYAAKYSLEASVSADAPVTIAKKDSVTAGERKTDTYTVTAKKAGDYTITLKNGEEVAAQLQYNVAEAYPSDPAFNALSGYGNQNDQTKEANVHDPVVIEADGAYYSFSTDNMGPDFGYQVRKSKDLIHWEYVGAAIENCGGPSTAADIYKSGKGGLQKVYDVLSKDPNWGNTWTLWAPDVTEAADGGYWLYGCWTANFGQGHSIIFQCRADKIEGPYKYTDILVYSYDGWVNGPNAIDPAIYYDAEGKMYMAYGSFNGGIYVLELDSATGLRKDGYKGDQLLAGSSLTAAERYGSKLVGSSSMEGPALNYHENVGIYTGDVKNFDASQMTYKNLYYLMGSAGSLSSDYNMRSYSSENSTTGFTSYSGDGANSGNRVSGSFSWRTSGGKLVAPYFDFAYPGHNDMLTTSAGKNILAYHNRITFDSGNRNHYLFTSLYSFNSRGDLIMNPNRYAGEAERKVTEAEITKLSSGKYMYVLVDSSSYSQLENGGYAQSGLVLKEDHAVELGGENVGEWYLYGENYMYMEYKNVKYYGVALPAYIQREKKGGLTISLLSESGGSTLYLNMEF